MAFSVDVTLISVRTRNLENKTHLDRGFNVGEIMRSKGNWEGLLDKLQITKSCQFECNGLKKIIGQFKVSRYGNFLEKN